MRKKTTDKRSVDEVLQSTSDTLYPADLGERVVTLKSKDVDGDTPLHVVLWRNDTFGALLLIDSGIDVNAVGDMGETPLHIAIGKENTQVATALIKAGARADIRSELGSTPKEMYEAASSGFRKEIR
ncbi:MAG: ankyrin repeat domain-containing protein, partial [Pseudomonadota bacterium]